MRAGDPFGITSPGVKGVRRIDGGASQYDP
jgi:hypothetical protein